MIRAASVENKAVLVVATTSLAQDVSRELHCSEAEYFKCTLDVWFFMGDNGYVSGDCRRLSLDFLSIPRSPFISSFIGKYKLVIITSSNIYILIVVIVSS